MASVLSLAIDSFAERILLQDPDICIAIFFGRGRFNNGVLVQPAKSLDPRDVENVNEFRNKIWPTVSRMNAYAPAHSRLQKEVRNPLRAMRCSALPSDLDFKMILIVDPAKPLELTAKGTARRNVCLAKYEDEIETIYESA